MYLYIYTSVYVYIERERTRERGEAAREQPADHAVLHPGKKPQSGLFGKIRQQFSASNSSGTATH